MVTHKLDPELPQNRKLSQRENETIKQFNGARS
jgi:hypothetical protein